MNTVIIALGSGNTLRVGAAYIEGQIAVIPSIHSDGYSLTHIPSGYAIPTGRSDRVATFNTPRVFRKLTDAKRVAEFIAPLMPDGGELGQVPSWGLEEFVAVWSCMWTFITEAGIKLS